MGYLSKRKFEEREHYLVTGLLILIPALTFLGTLGRSLDWRLDYLGEFKLQAAVLSLFFFVWCAFKREWIKTSVFFVLVLLNLILIASHSYLFQKRTPMPDDSYTFSILHQNLKGADEKADDLRVLLENTPADFVFFTNVPVEIYRRLNEIIGDFQLQNQTLDKTGKMKLILARTPSVDRGKTSDDNGLWISRVIGSRKITLVLAGLENPWQAQTYRKAKQAVFDLADFSRSRDEPVVLMGNFGATGWSWLLNDLEAHAGLKPQDELLESGTDDPVYRRRPTDHIYTHPGIGVSDVYAENILNTDHNAILALFKLAPFRKEIEFFELQPILPEEELLQPPT